MAIVTVTIIEGRDRATKEALMQNLSNAVIDTLGAEPRQVRVVIHEVKDGDYAVGGKPVYLSGHDKRD